jgi:outer membrane protein assembly factor BamB
MLALSSDRATRRAAHCTRRASLLGAALALLACSADEAGETTASDPVVPPIYTVTLSGVADGAIVGGSLDLEAKVTGGALIRVEFHVGSLPFASDDEEPYQATIDTAGLADGPLTLAAVAVIDSKRSQREELGIVIDNTPPSIALLEPSGSAAFHGGDAVALRFDIADPSGIDDVLVEVSGVPVDVTGPPWAASVTLDDLAATPADLPLPLVVRVEASDTVVSSAVASFDVELRSRLAWRFDTLGEIWAPPAFGSDGAAYFGSRDAKAYAVDPSGALRWSFDTGDEIVLSPGVEPGTATPRIWVPAGSKLHALDSTGVAVGAPYDAGSTLGTEPIVGADSVYVGTFGGQLVALDRASLGVRWTFSAGDAVQGAPAILDGGLLVFGSDDRRVYGVDSLGAEAWRFETGGAVWSDAVRTASGDVLIGSHDGYLYELDRFGSKRWEFETRGQIWGAAAESPSGAIAVSSTYRRLYGLDAGGAEQWRSEAAGYAYATPAIASDGTVFAVGTDGRVEAFDAAGTLRWSYSLGGEVLGAPRLSPDGTLLLIGANDRHLYALYARREP